MQTTIEQRLLDRLDFFKIQPALILDLGVGLGRSTHALKRRYPQALVMGVDLSPSMLSMAKKQSGWWSKPGFVRADALALPLAAASVDLIFANQLLPYLADLNAFFKECQRILKPWGCLLFSSLGPDTFKELGPQAFTDMHDVGDALLKTGFIDPVMDREDLVLRYASQEALIDGLAGQGESAHLQVTPELWQAYPRDEGKWPLSYEVIYGQAWRGEAQLPSASQTISWQALKASLKKG
jgi:malonyl-CoA O-methyltransferase